ncbi:MAG: AAA family ATPase, partial [Thermoplasmata archaeon]
MNNPFVFGESVPADDPDGLAAREEELDLLRRSMAGGRNVIVIAPRRYGKTSLIKRAVIEARAAGGRSGWVSLGDCTSPRDVAETLLAGVLSGPASWGQRMQSGVRRRLETLGAAVRLRSGSPDASAEVSVTLRPAESEGGWRDTIAEVLGTLRDAGEDGRPVSFVIDEFQAAHEIDVAIPGVVKRMVDELRGVSLVLSGSRRHLMEQLTSGAAAPLARIGTTMALPKVPREAMVDFLV